MNDHNPVRYFRHFVLSALGGITFGHTFANVGDNRTPPMSANTRLPALISSPDLHPPDAHNSLRGGADGTFRGCEKKK